MCCCADDLTYVGGMLVTLQSLLERIEQLHHSNSLVGWEVGHVGSTKTYYTKDIAAMQDDA